MAETIEKVLQLKKHLERYFERENAVEKVLYVFKKLERLPVNLDILQDTGIGKTVNSYRKHGEGVGDAARALVAYWKQLVAEQSEPEATIKTETAHETTYDSTMRIPNMESPPKQSSKSKDSSAKKSSDEPLRKKAKIHTMSDSEDEEQQDLNRIKQEPSSPKHADHSNKKHSSGKHHSDNTKHHKIKVEPAEETISYEKPIDHQKIKIEPTDEKNYKHKQHKDKKHEKSSSRGDKHNSSKYRDERKSENRHDHKSSKHGKYSHKDSNDSSIINGVDVSIVKNEAEEERKKLKAKTLKAEENVRDDSTTDDVDLSLVKEEKEDKIAHQDNKEHSSSSHRSKRKHHKHNKHKDERSDKVKKDSRIEDAASVSIKQEKVESEIEQNVTTEHNGKSKNNAKEQSKDREPKNKHNTTVKIKTEKDAESNEKQKSVATDPEYDNCGLSFEDMLMAGVPIKKKKKPSSGTSVNAASTNTNSAKVKSEEEKRDKHKNNQHIDSSSSSYHHKHDKHSSSSGKSKHEKHHKSSHKDRDGKSSSKEKSSHKRKHKDKEDRDERKEKKLKLDIPEPPKEKIKLEPTDLISSLPDISPNYKPLPKIDMTSPSRHLAIEEIANTIGTKTHTRTQVYSGRRTKFLPTVPSLYDSCLLILQENLDSLDFVGGVPYDILRPVLEKATPNQLYNIEDSNPQFIGETEELWEKHCKKDFRNKQKDEFEAWRELYIRCHDDRDRKLKALTAKVSLNMAKSQPVRQTKLAYVDVSAKPPRGVRRAQLKNGTAGSMNKQDPLAKLSSHVDSKPVKVPAPPKEAPGRPPMMPQKKVVAPMMKKTLRFIKNVPSLRRK